VEDERLQAELDSLRVTAALLGMAERMRVPRSFTLNPAMYGRPARSDRWASLGLGGFSAWATAGVTILVVLVCGGVLLFQSTMGMMATPAPAESIAEAPELEAVEQSDAAANRMAEEPTEAPAEAAAEAPMDALPAPTISLPTASGGVGGGPPQATATDETMPGQRNGTENGTDSRATSAAAPSIAAQKQPTDGSPQPPLPDESQYQAYTALAETSTPTPTWIDGQVLGLPVKWVLVLAGVITVIAVGLLINTALKRRSR
jgi:hypothetical protein